MNFNIYVISVEFERNLDSDGGASVVRDLPESSEHKASARLGE